MLVVGDLSPGVVCFFCCEKEIGKYSPPFFEADFLSLLKGEGQVESVVQQEAKACFAAMEELGIKESCKLTFVQHSIVPADMVHWRIRDP